MARFAWWESENSRNIHTLFRNWVWKCSRDAGFHSTCYRRFIDKKRLDAAEKRVTRRPEVQDAHKDQSVSSSSSTSTECPTKKLRSRTGLPVVCAGPVLPALCIIWTSTLLWQANAKRTIFHRRKRCQQVGTHSHTFEIWCHMLDTMAKFKWWNLFNIYRFAYSYSQNTQYCLTVNTVFT